MNSIQVRLTVRLVLGVLAVSILGSLAVYFVFRGSMLRQFDDTLRTEAQSIALRFVRDDDGHYEFQPPGDAATLFRRGDDPDFFCIRQMDGRVVVKSASLANVVCPGLDLPATYEGHREAEVNGLRHHGKNLRAIFLTFVPPAERGISPDRFQIILAAEHEEIDHLLSRLLRALGLVAVIAGAATALLVAWTVRRDLAPLRALAGQASEIGAGQLDKRFVLAGAPQELQPICGALNGLLERMAETLKRERRFTADAAHELRTPVAELRSLCEVALAAGEPKVAAEALTDASDIAVQMESLIDALLALRRGEQKAALVAVDIAALARQVYRDAGSAAKARGLFLSWDGPEQAEALCDKTLLTGVLRNLFDNAVRYTEPGGSITCHVSPEGVVIRNRPHELCEDDIVHLTEPFWRKDKARSCGAHAGLGLALCEAYCCAFGGELGIRLAAGWLEFEVRFADQS